MTINIALPKARARLRSTAASRTNSLKLRDKKIHKMGVDDS
jgi:hypothetical protein